MFRSLLVLYFYKRASTSKTPHMGWLSLPCVGVLWERNSGRLRLCYKHFKWTDPQIFRFPCDSIFLRKAQHGCHLESLEIVRFRRVAHALVFFANALQHSFSTFPIVNALVRWATSMSIFAMFLLHPPPWSVVHEHHEDAHQYASYCLSTKLLPRALSSLDSILVGSFIDPSCMNPLWQGPLSCCAGLISFLVTTLSETLLAISNSSTKISCDF